MSITNQQLAELLIGVARSQQAIIDAVTLQDFPARVLVQCQGRAGPNLEQIVKDLDDLLAGKVTTPSAIAPATARAAAAAPRPAAPAAPAATAAPQPVGAPAPAASAPAAAGSPAPNPAAPGGADNDLDMT